MAKLICVHCGAGYGQRYLTEEAVRWADGEEMPPYRGNAVVVRERYHGKTMSREAFLSLRMTSTPQLRKFAEADAAILPEKPMHVAYRWLWDGETYIGGCAPFCTNRCAIEYARKAYNCQPINTKQGWKR